MADPRAWGIEPGYHDVAGVWRDAPPDTVASLLAAMGGEEAAEPPGLGSQSPVWVVRAGERVAAPGPWLLRTEDGGEVGGHGGELPPDIPLGYHCLDLENEGRSLRLIVSPARCMAPPATPGWGWAAQLYAVRSAHSQGLGDLADLAHLGRWAREAGASLVLLNPLHAPLPGFPQQPSPYYPSSRCWRSPLYLRVPGVAPVDHGRIIDRDAVWRRKLAALERRWVSWPGDPGFERWREAEGPSLHGYATFCALAEVHSDPWPSWPSDVCRPDAPGVARFGAAKPDRIRFHEWLQWLLDGQLAEAAATIPLVHDVAIGVDPAGADAWLWQDCFVLDARVGAPPDEFNTQGQDWGLPPLDPWRLRLEGFEPFIRTLRSCFRHAGGIRIDHVMGLFRLFWIPPGGGPRDGTYVRYPWPELLDILALESHRARAYVVGEDLGTVEDSVRLELAERGVLSYRLLWFESDKPAAWPAQSLGTITTHDLPTVAGLWTGRDLEEQHRLELAPNVASIHALRGRLVEWTGLPADASVADAVEGAHRLLADAASVLVTATLEDALHVEERPNVPGTTHERPNWSRPLPRPLEEIEQDAGVAAVAAVLNRRPTRRD